MSQRLSGKSFDVHLGDLMMHVESLSASIEDGRVTVKTNGIPDGWVDGDASCSGDIELDRENFNMLVEQASRVGSWKALEPLDIVVYGKVGENECKIELYGCLLKVSDILDVKPDGKEKDKVKLGFEVTDKEFVRINGTPYLSDLEIEDL